MRGVILLIWLIRINLQHNNGRTIPESASGFSPFDEVFVSPAF